MTYGDRITWEYTHTLNSKSSLRRVKHGVFLWVINHTRRHWRKSDVQFCFVRFDRNKTLSRVPYKDIKHENITQ